MKSNNEAFLQPSLSTDFIDLYIVRQAILGALEAQISKFSGTLLDIGCGNMPYRKFIVSRQCKVSQYVGLDIKNDIYSQPDLYWDGQTIPLNPKSINCAMATEVLEHTPEPMAFVSEVYRILKPGGVFFFTVPFLWPLHDVPYDEYRFTPFALGRILCKAGFEDIELHALGGWNASLAQMIGLWVRRSDISGNAKSILSRMTVPLIRYLVLSDNVPNVFSESTMITGTSGTAIKR